MLFESNKNESMQNLIDMAFDEVKENGSCKEYGS